MEKYRIKNKPSEKGAETEIRVNNKTSFGSYLGYIGSLFEKAKEMIEIKGTGYAIPKAISLAELVRKRFVGLFQIINFGTIEIVDEYEPLEEGLDTVILKRNLPFVNITLSKIQLDKEHPGYSDPLPEKEVRPFTKMAKTSSSALHGRMIRGRSRGRRGGARGRGAIRSFWARGSIRSQRRGNLRRAWGTVRRGRVRPTENKEAVVHASA